MRLFLTYFSLLLSLFTAAQPKHEVRAVWITTAYGLDWPNTKATSRETAKRQQEELINMLDKLKAANFNTVLFQARTRGEVFYRSDIEPMSAELTGQTNKNPGYDPLAFVVEECHKRGMECHAWMVALPLGGKKHVASLGSHSVVRKRKKICVAYKNEWFLNPGQPETKEYLMSLIKEVTERYDVDGIHLDYLRYPENAKSFPDKVDYRRSSQGRTLEQWRRDCLTDIVRYVYRGVKALKPWVKVSTSPVGKYRDTARYPSKGWNAYHTVYQDPQRWMAEGIQDQIYPMIYFRGNNFYPFALDWQEQNNGRHVVAGLGVYFLNPNEGNWPKEEIERQIHFVRHQKMAGEACYRARFVTENEQGIYDTLADGLYAFPALQPPMPWLDNTPPSAPSELKTVVKKNGYMELSWKSSEDNDSINEPTYTVYASDSLPIDTESPQNIVATGIKGTRYVYAPILPWNRKIHFAITAIDRYGNESEAVMTESF